MFKAQEERRDLPPDAPLSTQKRVPFASHALCHRNELAVISRCLRRGTFIQLLHPTGNVTQGTGTRLLPTSRQRADGAGAEKMYFCSLHRPAGIGWQFGVGSSVWTRSLGGRGSQLIHAYSMCQESGCIKHASFGVPGSKKVCRRWLLTWYTVIIREYFRLCIASYTRSRVIST